VHRSAAQHLLIFRSQYDFYNATIHDVDFGEDGVTPTRLGAPKTMTGIHQVRQHVQL
jgi:hypothetical protein